MEFDVIVVGAGLSGSWVAKEFCDAGFKTVILERGRDVQHNVDYPTTNLNAWEMENRGLIPEDVLEQNPILSKCYAFREDTQHFFTKDSEHPYVQTKPFDWIKPYQVGGRSLLWARQVQRWSDYDFEGPKRDNYAVDWPIRYKDIAPWYDKVEHFIGVSGNKDGLDVIPDGDFLKPLPFSCGEQYLVDFVKKNYQDRHLVYSRVAHLTEVRDIHKKQGRGLCQNRTICERGCPFGAYYSANSSTLPWAKKTGNLTIMPNCVVKSVIYDDELKKATGVEYVDAITKETKIVKAKVIFMNAGTLNTNLVLLNSRSSRFPNGLGNDNGLLGKFVSFHNYRARVTATYTGAKDSTYIGRKPAALYMPRFKNVKSASENFSRGYAVYISMDKGKYGNENGLGYELIKNLDDLKYSDWNIFAMMMGETIPKESNKVSLHSDLVDPWGIPQLEIDIDYDGNDLAMMEDFYKETIGMFEKAGLDNIEKIDTGQAPGLDIHEMGGVRMGTDLNTSLLNSRNQMHLCENVYVTDGACMTTVSCQNPSLTFMALAARAANYAIEEMKREI
jgi:choline dehydrogenase-like flavoprotein